jgi:phage baseplate assembly protein W
MAVTKSLAIEDGNLQTPSIITTRKRNFSDLDLTFTAKTTGDVYKKIDAGAVKQSVKTILQTNYNERPFNPTFGANLRSKLFENFTAEENAIVIENEIRNVLAFYEPRAAVLVVNVNDNPDRNSLDIRVEFKVVNTQEIVILETSVSRIR